MNQIYEYSCRRLELKDGPVYVDFDFIPKKPNASQLRRYVKPSCKTCLLNEPLEIELHGCHPEIHSDTGCKQWICNHDAHIEAENRYWLDLHSKTMKGKPVPYGRKVHGLDEVPYLTYPDDE